MLYSESQIGGVVATAHKLREYAGRAHTSYGTFPDSVPGNALRAGNLDAVNKALSGTKREYGIMYDVLNEAAERLEMFAEQLRFYNDDIRAATRRYEANAHEIGAGARYEYELFEISEARKITESEMSSELNRLRDRAPIAAQAHFSSPAERTAYQKFTDRLRDGNTILGRELSNYVPHEVASFITNATDSLLITGIVEGVPGALYTVLGGPLNPVNAPLGNLLYGKSQIQIAQDDLAIVEGALRDPGAFANAVLRLDQFHSDPAGWAGQMAGLVAGALITRGAGGANDLATIARSLRTLPARFRTTEEFTRALSNDLAHYGESGKALMAAGVPNSLVYSLREETQALFEFDERTGSLRWSAEAAVRGYGAEDVHRVLMQMLDKSFQGLVYNNKAIDGVGGFIDELPQYVTQSKSINLSDATYLRGNAAYNTLMTYANKLIDLQSQRVDFITTDGLAGVIRGRSLTEQGGIKYVIEIPRTGIPEHQIGQLSRLVNDINSIDKYRAIDIIIVEIPR